MGYREYYDDDFILYPNENKEHKEMAINLALESDLVIFGSESEKLYKN